MIFHFSVAVEFSLSLSESVLRIISGEKTFSPSSPRVVSLLSLSPKRTRVRLKSLLYLVWLRQIHSEPEAEPSVPPAPSPKLDLPKAGLNLNFAPDPKNSTASQRKEAAQVKERMCEGCETIFLGHS